MECCSIQVGGGRTTAIMLNDRAIVLDITCSDSVSGSATGRRQTNGTGGGEDGLAPRMGS